MRREVKVGAISWINRTPNPITTTLEALALEPAWLVKTCIGLAATANPDPGDNVADFVAFQRTKQFRAMMYCHISFDENPATGISNCQVHNAIHDPGWTPPFSQLNFPSTFLKPDSNIWSWTWHQGEASPLSLVNTQARHRNTTITGVGGNEIVLVNGLIKFRAGQHTDDVGVTDVGAPFHVPWVWCEMLLTWVPGGTLKLYGRGSNFPTHAFYLNGGRLARRTQDLDASFPRTRIHVVPNWMPRPPTMPTLANPLQIDARAMIVYPVLAAGAPASGPQVAINADAGLTTPVDRHPYTAAGFPTIVR